MLELHINKCKNLGPVIYAKSNPNHGFTKSVGFRDSLSKRKKKLWLLWKGIGEVQVVLAKIVTAFSFQGFRFYF